MKRLFFALVTCVLMTTCGVSLASDQKVSKKIVVTVRPLYGIAASILEGVSTPELLLEGRSSPHTYHLNPADVARVKGADLLFWIGPSYEAFLAKVARSFPEAQQIQVQTLTETKQYPVRTNDLWSDDEGHNHGHAHHDHDHSHHHHQYEAGAVDGHMWLDVDNAKAMAQALANRLMVMDPQHASQYTANLKNFLRRMDDLKVELSHLSQDLKNEPILVFHDAYQYLEKSLGLKVMGSILLEPDMPAGAYHLDRLHQLVESGQCKCIFSEPQFPPALVQSLNEKSKVPVAHLDPLGSDVQLSSYHYEETLRALVKSVKACVKK